jgi:hypothetical protein
MRIRKFNPGFRQCCGTGAGAESRAEEPKINCLLEPEPQLRNVAPASFITTDSKKYYRKKTWLLKKFLYIVANF